MKKIIGANIARYRKEKNMTQQELANHLNISFQAVSKWECGQTTPDVYLLPLIASILGTSVDQLLGYSHNFDGAVITDYEERYRTDEYYWGVKPSRMCLEILRLMPPQNKEISVIDIGCGEGKDAVFLARCGYKVSAFDVTDTGIEKTKRLAEKAGVYVDAFKANIMDFRLEREYDILFSSGVFHYIPPELRGEIVENYQEYTAENGLNVFNVFVEKPFIEIPPDKDQRERCLWKSGELFMLYHNWYFEECLEEVFDCNSGGIPHKHAMDKLIARKIKKIQ